MMGWRDVEMSKEEKCRARIVQVAFVDEKKDAVMKRTQSLPPNPSNQRS